MSERKETPDSSDRPPVRPVAIVLNGAQETRSGGDGSASPAAAAPPAQEPKALPVTEVREEEADPFAPDTTDGRMAAAAVPESGRRSLWLRLFLSALAGLVLVWVIESAWRWVTARLAEDGLTGRLLLALAALALFSALMLVLREVLALWRLARLTRLHDRAEAALAGDDETAMQAVMEALTGLYGRRADMRWPLARLKEAEDAILTPAERLALAERELMAPLDAAARRAIVAAARRIAVLTAMIPVPALDVAIVGLQTLRLVRIIAALYGVRPGWIGGWRLLRMSLAHLAIAGAVALSDTLLQTVLGKGLAGRLSARFGEGAVNALLAARIGLAAMEIVRPLPFQALEPPSLAVIARAALDPRAEADPAAPSAGRGRRA